GLLAEGVAILGVKGQDPRGDLLDDLVGVETRGGPVAEIRAESHALVAILEEVPEFVGIAWNVAFAGTVVMEADLNVVLFRQLLDRIERVDALGSNPVDAELLAELED